MIPPRPGSVRTFAMASSEGLGVGKTDPVEPEPVELDPAEPEPFEPPPVELDSAEPAPAVPAEPSVAPESAFSTMPLSGVGNTPIEPFAELD